MERRTSDEPGKVRPQPNHRFASRGFYLIVALFVGIVLGLLTISRLQAFILDSVRAYVAGEGQWSKAQKSAVRHLSTYAATGDDAHYRRFLEEIAVIRGDRRARLALEQAEPARAAAREGFLAGRNHPADVDNMIDFFLRFQNFPYIETAVATWEAADGKVARLRRLAGALHAEINASGVDGARARELLGEVRALDEELTALESRFSDTLGEAARWSEETTLNVVYGSVLMLLAIGLLLSWRIVRGIRHTERALIESEARFRGVVDADIIGVYFWRDDGRVIDANNAFLEMTGFGREEMEAGGINWRRLTPPEHIERDDAALEEMEGESACTPYEKEIVRRDGKRIAIYVGSARLGTDSRCDGVSFALDVTLRRESERVQRLAAAVFRATTEGIMVTDRNRRIEAVNPSFTLITGYEADEVIGQDPHILSSNLHDRRFYRDLWRELEETGHWRGEIWNRRKGGQIYPEWLSINAIRDESGEVVQYVGVFSDITERKERERVIWHQAHHDILTDLPNRLLFSDRLAQHLRMARREGSRVALMFIDLDRFKEINDTLGHKAGDVFLREIAGRIAASVRESDTVARMSGDEFTVSLPGLKQGVDARHVAEKILTACSKPVTVGEREATVSASIGIAIFPEDADTQERLLQHADAAMYAAKQAGRNALYFYGEEDAGGPDATPPRPDSGPTGGAG